MTEKRLQEFEEKLAYLEMANAQLEEEIFRQQQEIDALTKAHRSMQQRVEVLQDRATEQVSPGQSSVTQNEKPPHY
jgi:uncharacterized coiled-coil protein SlyX